MLTADEDDLLEVTRVCWECGWEETRELCVDEIRVESGDEAVQKRRELLEEVNDELERIESIDALRDALAGVERVRGHNRSDFQE